MPTTQPELEEASRKTAGKVRVPEHPLKDRQVQCCDSVMSSFDKFGRQQHRCVVMACMCSEKAARGDDFSTHQPLVGLVCVWVEDELNFSDSVPRGVQIRVCFVLRNTDRRVQLDKPIGLRSIALADAFIVRWTRKCLPCKSTGDLHNRRFIGETSGREITVLSA
jgi:hypothetical protein